MAHASRRDEQVPQAASSTEASAAPRLALTREVLRAALALPSLIASFVDARGAADAAVAIPIHLGPTPSATLVLRARTLRDHAGEVGFPGGKVEPSDADLAATALRESDEEVALGPADLEILGRLTPTPVITARYLIHPFVAVVHGDARPRVASPEIERVLEVPLLPWISGALPIQGVEIPWPDGARIAPHFELDGCVLYGASAYIFYELLLKLATVLGRQLPAPVLQPKFPWSGRYGD